MKIDWKDNDKDDDKDDDFPDTIFKSGCVQEIGTSKGLPDEGEFEGEFEGIVENFPGVSGPRAAIATFTITVEKGEVATGKFSLELGTTCNQPLTPPVTGLETELSLSWGGKEPHFVHIDNKDAGRWAFPVGKTPTNCPLEF